MYKVIIFLAGVILTVRAVTLQESLSPPCHKTDNDCIREKFDEMIQYMAKNGAPECGVPEPIDPYDLSIDPYHVSVLLGAVDVKVNDGYLKGLGSCKITKSTLNFERSNGESIVKCSQLEINGNYDLTGLLQGKGLAKISVDDLEIDLHRKVKIVTGSDEEDHLQFSKSFDYNIGSLKFNVSDIHVGRFDVTERGNKFIQNNWKLLMALLGRRFVAEAVRIYFENSEKLFECIPAKYIVTDNKAIFW